MTSLNLHSLLFVVAFLGVGGNSVAEDLVPPDTRIVLERTACFGSCPVYRVEVDAKGLVTFEGKEFVATLGKRTAFIPVDEVQRLIGEFKTINFLSLPESFERTCPIEVTCNPSTIVSLTLGGHARTVNDDHGCTGNALLDEVRRLEEKIDIALQTKKWTDGKNGVEPHTQ